MKALEQFFRHQQQRLPRHRRELAAMLANLYFFR
jgi:hypothetical protein